MRLHEVFLSEGRGGYLYHSTTLENAISILADNVIRAKTEQPFGARRGDRVEKTRTDKGPIYGWELEGGKRLQGVSLTRDYGFALSWSREVILVLDQRRLNQDYKIKPYDHINAAEWDYRSPGHTRMQPDWLAQAEEFVIGPIRNLDRYLVSVNVSPSHMAWDREEFSKIMRHPLLNRVVPRRAAAFYAARPDGHTLMESQSTPLMVLVHPGSACGSADYNLGKYNGRAARDYLEYEINRWQGGIIVVDGELSDELTSYAAYNSAILNALQRAQSNNLPSSRIYGCALNQSSSVWVKKAIDSVIETGLPKGSMVHVTGAWLGEHGCVNAVSDGLRRAGYQTTIMDSAVEESDEEGDDDNDEDEDYEDLQK